eukprot:m.176792 g.176792  ORF g.176792 m.176792 type:complete len:324 (+) comp17370_c3_seq1:120-1091(+)
MASGLAAAAARQLAATSAQHHRQHIRRCLACVGISSSSNSSNSNYRSASHRLASGQRAMSTSASSSAAAADRNNHQDSECGWQAQGAGGVRACATFLRGLLQWVLREHAPAGIKLNAALNRFLGHFFIGATDMWEYLLLLGLAQLPCWPAITVATAAAVTVAAAAAVVFLLCAPLLTTSSSPKPRLPLLPWHLLLLPLAVCVDALTLVSFPLLCCHAYATRLFYANQLDLLTSLCRSFMGKKWNPLRQRVDTCSSSSSQLMLGTVMFSLLLFLLPTTAVYHALFSLMWAPVAMAKATLLHLMSVLVDARLRWRRQPACPQAGE